ncbi:PfkB family carbohydrate kinase [Bacillus sp. REN16]|uniref:PfkB family carbohydrate kinase n=1 Tax=Bacillus sp. REN16 TaxID=2887296 RepID=UPI001E3EAB34|nr:PfkB family carbohydrate kinase [Bacillus sp. REN16]MCC3358956.1 PfkB family carbohydrate kinase [Bacillus sp. REN16]
MNDIISIGDAMITFNPTINGPMRYVSSFERSAGSSELNVLIGCSRLGLKAGWISRLGKDEFGRYIYNFARGEGIDVAEVHLVKGYNTSINFREILGDGSGRTFYYRGNSPTNEISLENINENFIKNSKVLHISGVFISLNKNNVTCLIDKELELINILS